MSSLNIKKWKSNKNIKLLFKIFKKDNEETRFIGGCIRDLIIKKKENYDVDLATTLKPNEIIKILKKKKIKIIKSGFSHGTVIAILNKEKFEITTLSIYIFSIINYFYFISNFDVFIIILSFLISLFWRRMGEDHRVFDISQGD